MNDLGTSKLSWKIYKFQFDVVYFHNFLAIFVLFTGKSHVPTAQHTRHVTPALMTFNVDGVATLTILPSECEYSIVACF